MSDNTFKTNYGILKKHAEALRTQQEPNIDDLLAIVTESVAAYKVCKERIDAVELALSQALGDAVEPEKTTPAAQRNQAPDQDDDVPF
jgi:exodeoxyribonuclease VII small subunit